MACLSLWVYICIVTSLQHHTSLSYKGAKTGDSLFYEKAYMIRFGAVLLPHPLTFLEAGLNSVNEVASYMQGASVQWKFVSTFQQWKWIGYITTASILYSANRALLQADLTMLHTGLATLDQARSQDTERGFQVVVLTWAH